MDFRFSDEQEMLRGSVSRLLKQKTSLLDLHRMLALKSSFDEALWVQLVGLGLTALGIPERVGGQGGGDLELAVVQEELGRVIAAVPFYPSVCLASFALVRSGSAGQQAAWLPRLAAGEVIAGWGVGSIGVRDERTGVTADSGLLRGSCMVLAGAAATVAIVPAEGAHGVERWLVALDQPRIERRPAASLDETQPDAVLAFDGAQAERLGDADIDERSLLDRAAVLLAFEQLGGAQRCLDLTIQYVKQRRQFDRPIGSFQAVKHRLADMAMAVELARSNCLYGAWALEHEAPELHDAAGCARVAVSEAYDYVAQEGLHLHGGLGFTWEADPHLFLRRAKHRSGLLGPASVWKHKLARQWTTAR